MKKFSFEEKQGVWGSCFEKAGFGVTYFTYEPLAMTVFMRGITKTGKSVYLVLSTTPDGYLTDAISVLTDEEYKKKYEEYMNDPELEKDEEGGNPKTPDSEYSPIAWEELKEIVTYCDIDWEEFKSSII